MSGNWGAALTAFVPLGIGMIVMFFMCFVALIFWIRMSTKDKIACTFHRNHKKGGALLKYDPSNNCVWLGGEGDPNREKYLITEDETEWIEWPGFLPHMFNVTIRSLDFVRGSPNPINVVKKSSSNITAKALRLQSDGNVLQAVYMHAKDSLNTHKVQSTSTMALLLLVLAVAAAGFSAYKTITVENELSATRALLQLVANAQGIQTGPVLPPIQPIATPTPGVK